MQTPESTGTDRTDRPAGLPRHLLSVLALPVMATVAVPWWLMRTAMSLPATARIDAPWDVLARLAGALLLVSGLALFGWCIRLFRRVGQGTIAPWDPTRRLVVVGPYRHVRNPMITAVATILLGEATLLASPRLVLWCAAFIVVNHVYFVASEEPGLRRRFGAQYEHYRRAVPRWIPRRQPWSAPHER